MPLELTTSTAAAAATLPRVHENLRRQHLEVNSPKTFF
jgi:hypothetical protein